MTRARLGAVGLIAVVLTLSTACNHGEVSDRPTEGQTPPSKSPSSSPAPSPSPSKSPIGPDPSLRPPPKIQTKAVRPTLPKGPITYAGITGARFSIAYLNGTIQLDDRPDRVVLGFRVQESPRGTPELVEKNLAAWKKRGAEVHRVRAGNASGYWAQSRLTEAEDGESGDELRYVISKGAVTVTARVLSPKGAVSSADREALEAVVASVRIDESRLRGVSDGGAPYPIVPFTYRVPESLKADGRAELGPVFWVDHTVDGLKVRTYLNRYPDPAAARKAYQGKADQFDRAGVDYYDVKKQASTATTVGRRVDEGLGRVASSKGDGVMFFALRKGSEVLFIKVDGAGRPIRQVQNSVSAMLTSLRFG